MTDELKTLNDLRSCEKEWGEPSGEWYVCGEKKLCSACNQWRPLRQEAIKWIKQTQNGTFSIEREIPDSLKGIFANRRWNDELFSYGMEYGLIFALYHFFNLTESEVNDNGKT